MKIDSSKKEGYIGGAIFAFVGILFLVTGFDQGWASGKLTIIMGLFLGGLGVLGVIFPEIGEIIWHYLQNIGEDDRPRNIRASQYKPRKSPQATGQKVYQKNTYITHNYGSKRKRRKKR